MVVKVTHSTPADGTFSATGATAWNADHTLSGLGTMAEQDANNVNITGGSLSGVTGVATSGTNSNITSLTGLTTPLSVAQGGSGTATPSLIAGTKISISGSWPNQTINTSGVASSGTNSDITSLTGLTTPLSVAQGGSGTATPGLIAGTNISISGSWPNQTINSTVSGTVTSVTASSPLASTGGATPDISLSGVITGTNGGTGVNNGSKTITLGGNLTTSGAFNTTLTATNTTSLTMPVSGTLISSVTNMAANPVTGTPSASNYLRGDGTWATIPAASLVVNSTPTSGGAAGQIMFDTGSVLQESSNLTWDNTNNVLKLVGATKTGVTLSGVAITGTAGQFSCSAASVPLVVGQLITISGTFGGTGSISGYANPTNYYISATNGSTTFTLVTLTNTAITTSAGTPTGLTYTYDPYPLQNLTQTWNNSALAFNGLKLNVTDTASNTSSLLMDVQVGGVSQLSLRKDGRLFLNGPANTQATIVSTAPFRTGSIGIGYANNQGASFGDAAASNFYANADSRGFSVSSALAFGITASTAISSIDTFLTRRAAANWRFGAADAAAPVAQTLSVQSVVAGTSNTAGANLTITGSQGTGTGAGGDIIFQTALAGTSGTAQNTLITALRIYSNQTVAVGKAYTVATLPAAGTQGRRAWVTDALAPTFLGVLTGGGAVVTPVFDNGAAWVAG